MAQLVAQERQVISNSDKLMLMARRSARIACLPTMRSFSSTLEKTSRYTWSKSSHHLLWWILPVLYMQTTSGRCAAKV
eukprot:5430198-Pleurochrysis_carterae.AAC.1